MDYCCEVCLKKIKGKNKYKYFKSKTHQEFDKCKHRILSYKDIDIRNIDEAFYLHNIEHNNEFDYYLINCDIKLVFNDYQYCPYVMSNVFDNKTVISWKNFFGKSD